MSLCQNSSVILVCLFVRELVGPLLKSELGDGPYMAGSKFTALDIVFGYNMEVYTRLLLL